MQTKRIIACLDTDKGRVVKGKNFQGIKDVADPLELARRYNDVKVDELVLYDITASTEGRDIFINLVKKVADEVSVPFTVGGGIRTIADIENVISAGADKVSINSAAIKNPELIKEASEQFGSSRIVLAMDVKEIEQGKWTVHAQGGQKDTGIEAIGWAIKMEELGAGEIVVNSIDEDGAKTGFNIPLTKKIADAVQIPVVASGGAGEPEHFADVLKNSGAAGALAASVFHYEEIDIPGLREYLKKQGISMRGINNDN